MHRSYQDITSRLGEPLWYDEHAVPRYNPFSYRELGVYIDNALLVEIACQDCRKTFRVAAGWSKMDNIHAGYRLLPKEQWADPETAEWEEEPSVVWSRPRATIDDYAKHFHYGDPPNHGCVGDTMNCLDYRVVEAWQQGGPDRDTFVRDGRVIDTKRYFEWVRRTDLEVLLEDHPDYADPAHENLD